MLDHSWKRWVAENKLLNIPDQELLGIMLAHGIDRQSAQDELSTISSNPYFMAAHSYTQLVHKRNALAMIQRELSRLNPKLRTIERRSNLTREEFFEQYYAANRPVILQGCLQDWKAMTRWTPQYLKATCGNVMVAISANRDEHADYESNAGKHRQNILFSEYVDHVHSGTETNNIYLTARDDFFKNPDVAPLLADIEPFTEYLTDRKDAVNMWYGPKGTYTPLHHDLMNIFMAQVSGRKQVRLIPSTEMDLVYNEEGVYSPVDGRNPDYVKFPKFREISAMEFVLEPGEVLFVPVGWWHDVRALEASITVSFTNFIYKNDYAWIHPKPLNATQQETPTAAQPQPMQMMHGISDEWMKWIETNQQHGRDLSDIIRTMEKSGFALAAIRLALGARFPEGYISTQHDYVPPPDYHALCDIPSARLEWAAGVTRIDDPRLQLYTLKHFMSDAECDAMIRLIDADLRPSTITVYAEGFRTSYTSDLSMRKDSLIRAVDERIAAMLGIALPYSEGIQAQRYEVGQEFKAHTDYFKPNTPEYDIHASRKGNRTWTFMIYLNDTPKGGGTKFVNLDKTFYPKRGMAVIWNNLHADGTPNADSIHWGMPVEEGEKYIITKWFRERGPGEMFEAHV